MTTAGSINLGVDIDAGDLRGELTRAVSAAMGPVLADLQKDLRGVQGEYKDTSKAADKSAAQQSAAAAKTESAIHGITNEQRKLAQQATTTGLVSVRSLKNMTRAIDEQARAWDRVAAAKARAAAVPDPNGPRGPPSSYTRASGGGGRGGGALGFLTSAPGLNAVALGASALPAATTAVVNLVGAIQQLGQAGLAMPGIFAGIAASVGTAVVGFQGMGGAVKALNEAANSTDPKKLQAAADALKDMAPAAADVAKSVSGLVTGPLKELQKAVAQDMFAGVSADLDSFADKAVPRAQAGMQQVAKSWNGTLKELLRVGGSDSSLSIMDRVFGNTAEAQTRFNKALEPLIHGFGTLAATGSDFLPRLADGLTKLATRFDNFITKADQTGQLAKWIDEGFKAAANFGTALLNIGKILTDITGAAGGDGGFLKWLADATGRLREFTSSTEGQEKLTKFFADGKAKLDEWLPILKDVVRITGDVLKGFQQWGDIILPIIGKIAGAIADMPSAVTAVVTAFLAWKSISGIASLLGGLGSVGSALDRLPGKAAGAVGGINKAFAGLAIGATAIGLSNDMVGGDNSNGSNLGGLGINVGGGAAAGFVTAGPLGAAIGALIGAGVTIFQRAKADLEQGAKQWEDVWQRDHDAGPGREGSREGQLAAVPALRGVQLPSLYDPSGALRPSGSDDLRKQLAPGGALAGSGFTINPDGTVVGPDGGVLPGLTLPAPAPPPPPPVQAQAQPSGGIVGIVGSVGPQVKEAQEGVAKLATGIQQLPEGEVKIKDPSPELIKNLTEVDATITKVSENEISVKAKTSEAQTTLDAFVLKYTQQQFQLKFAATVAPPTGLPVQPRAFGGAIFGGMPGKDSVPALLMPGEHVLTTADVAAMGGQANVYGFRRALHFADGGEVPGGIPGLPDDNSVTGLLMQIRDLLAGKGGTGPLVDTAKGVTGLAQDAKTGGTGAKTGPFGTPLKPRNAAYDAAAAAISALGGDPEKFIGMDPATLGTNQGGMLPVAGISAGGLAGGGGVDVAQLQKFALSGDVKDLPPGLSLNSPVVTAIVGARDKSKGGRSDQAISDLVGQGLGPGGFTGTLDSTNTSLVKALEKLRTKGLPGTPGTRGVAAVGQPGGVTGGLDAFAQSVSGGQYQWGASDLASGLSDCSGAVSDLVELVTEGQATSKRLFSTSDAGSVLSSLGAVSGAVPGALQIGWSDSHMRATLPSGTAFESGGGTGQGATYGGAAQGAAGMPNIMSLPVGALAGLGGGANPLGYSGAPVPVYIVGGPGGAGIGGNILGAGISAAGKAGAGVAGDVLSGVASLHLGSGAAPGPPAEIAKLLEEGNPLALAAMAGFNVQDFTRQGGDGLGPAMTPDQAFDASGRLFSDTGSITDRTTTSIEAQLDALRQQLTDAIDQVGDKLTEDAIKPVITSAIQSAMDGISDSVTAAIGTAMGQAAAPPIADAVKNAIPPAPAVAAPASPIPGMAEGGGIGGTYLGRDSVPAMLMPGEHVFTRSDVAAMGGQAGVYRFRSALSAGQVQGFATGGGVSANATVGADFFGVSEVPILGALVNVLVGVLLAVLGVTIEERDTLQEQTAEIRQFRGDFAHFDASGRLMSDVSALTERSDTSEQAAAEERIRILKIVIQELIKYIIEKVIVPIGKAVANTAIQAGAAAAGAAVNSQAPGAGSIVSSLISSAGSAGVDIVADVGGAIGVEVGNAAVDVIGELLQGLFPDLMTMLFGGGLFAPLAALFAGAATVTGSDLSTFDSGGLAFGMGMMPKATIEPERMLSPRQTENHERLTALLDSGLLNNLGGGSNVRTVNAPITVIGNQDAAENIGNHLLALLS